ncbi:uncharacterized protein ARMOST_01775 [Armillaria ostoyae]|uniref:DNA-directed RNA polymerase RBP11-like dimerisation domain-containing protein n=1 Tax=Armillaria ostoyae TaxID=47428 RepID=A0A284QPV9_ARMOS|nr:uncharacterized protein ARMOST_01775 [Armillaria ostoyae]
MTRQGRLYGIILIVLIVLMQLPNSVPHPSENFIHVRIQMYDHLSSLTALLTALDDLDALCSTIDTAYRSSLQTDTYERWEEKS